ncbi:MAG: adenylosuccinate synthase [Bifidobacteriaceae bacterium]|jgi:adenylosuccinate synthase|nr:adenylosuccinate synthase [Bifidobacteriaceae bacterium]
MAGIAVLGAQWGDEGKGKATDYLSRQIDYVVKFNGGNNAGHTVVIDEKHFALHLLPSGILTDEVQAVIGNGAVIDIVALFDELDQLKDAGVDDSRLVISSKAHILTLYHKALDKAKEHSLGSKKIGTTGKGIGPAYADKISRLGIQAADLLSDAGLRAKIQTALDYNNFLLTDLYGKPAMTVQQVIDEFAPYLERIKPMIKDVPLLLTNALAEGKTVLFEASQGALLDIDFGTYPFVTSSNTISAGIGTGAGIPVRSIDRVVGVAKAYLTRVGNGPFPTEQDNDIGELIRTRGAEVGVTTGRTRRCGHYDAVLARYSNMINGFTDMILTKLDVLTGFDKIPVCVAYKLRGKVSENMPLSLLDLDAVEPVYEMLPGWKEDITKARHFADLPMAAKKYVSFIEQVTNVKVSAIGVGPAREDIVVKE